MKTFTKIVQKSLDFSKVLFLFLTAGFSSQIILAQESGQAAISWNMKHSAGSGTREVLSKGMPTLWKPNTLSDKKLASGALKQLRDAIGIQLKKKDKVVLDFFVMSQCPFGVMAEQSILPVIREFGNRIEFRLNFIAGKYINNGRSVFNSLHGQPEIDEGMRQLAVSRDCPEKLFAYLEARAENYRDDNWQAAAAKAGINLDMLNQVIKSQDIQDLFRANIRQAETLGINASPTLLIDGVKYTDQLIDPTASAAAAYQTGTDPFTGSRYIAFTPTPTYAWISSSVSQGGGGTYHANYICQQLGYAGIGRYGGTCGTQCGYCIRGTSYTTPQSNTTFDGGGNAGSGQYGIILSDTVHWECIGTLSCTEPTITCPANIEVNNTPGSCGAVVNYPPATVTGTTPITVTYSQNSGTFFPVGITTVTATAINDCGTASCSFTVRVLDNEEPVITCPSNITVNTGTCNAVVNYTTPTATDNCTSSHTFNYTGSEQSFTVPAGVSSIHIQAFGAQSGNLSTIFCTQTGALGGSAAGNLSVTPGQILYVYVGQQGQLTNAANGGYSINAFNGGGKGWTWDSNNFIGGDYGSASSGGGASDVRVGGNSLNNRVIVAGGAGGGNCNYCEGGIGGGLVGGTGGCNGGGGTGGTQTAGGTNGIPGTFGAGGDADNLTTIGWVGGGGGGWYGGSSGQSHSAGGGGSSYIGGVTGGSTTPGVQSGNGQVILTWDGISGPSVTQTAGLPSGSSFPVGTTTNTFIATDASGNTATCSFTVTVNETQSPSITCPASATRPTDPGLFTYQVQNTEFNAAATDNCGEVTSLTYVLSGATTGSGTGTMQTLKDVLLNIGITTVSWMAMDASGNTATCSFTVTVNDENCTNYLIYATEDVDFGEYNYIAGDVGVTAANGKAKFKKYSELDPFTITAAEIDVHMLALVNNRVYSPATGGPTPTFMPYSGNTTGLNNTEVTVNGTLNGNWNDVRVKKGVTCTITGNNFGKITIEEGAHVTFTAAVINLEKMDVQKGMRQNNILTVVNYSNPASVKVKDKVDIGGDCRVNVGGPEVIFYVDDNISVEEKFEVKGENSQVTGNIMIPKGKLHVYGGNDITRPTIMTGLYIIEKLYSHEKYVHWNKYDCGTNNFSFVQQSTQPEVTTPVTQPVLPPVDKFRVNVYPNPAAYAFNIQVISNSKEPITVRVMDMNGKVLHVHTQQTKANSIRVGDKLACGTYMAEVIQGTNRKMVKLVKMN